MCSIKRSFTTVLQSFYDCLLSNFRTTSISTCLFNGRHDFQLRCAAEGNNFVTVLWLSAEHDPKCTQLFNMFLAVDMLQQNKSMLSRKRNKLSKMTAKRLRLFIKYLIFIILRFRLRMLSHNRNFGKWNLGIGLGSTNQNYWDALLFVCTYMVLY